MASNTATRLLLTAAALVLVVQADGDVGGTRKLFDVDAAASTTAPRQRDPRDYVLPPPPADWAERDYDVCSVGAGLSGVVLAERYTELQGATVLDKRPHIIVLDKRPHHRG